MMQIYKKFTDSQVKELMQRYLNKEIEQNISKKLSGLKKDDLSYCLKNLVKAILVPQSNAHEKLPIKLAGR